MAYVQDNGDGTYSVVDDSGQVAYTDANLGRAEGWYNINVRGEPDVGQWSGNGAVTPGFQTPLESMRAQLQRAGYPGPWDDASVRAAFARTVNGGNAAMGGAFDWSGLWGALTGSNQQRFDWDRSAGLMGLTGRVTPEYRGDYGEYTLPYQQLKWQQDMAQRDFEEGRRQFDQGQFGEMARALLGAATSLRGPENWLQYAEMTNGGRNIFDALRGSQVSPSFGVTGYSNPANLQGLLSALGLVPGGGGGMLSGTGGGERVIPPGLASPGRIPGGEPLNYAQGVGSAAGLPDGMLYAGGQAPGPGNVEDPTGEVLSRDQLAVLRGAVDASAGVMGSRQAPNPWQVNPAVWDASSDTARRMVLGAVERGYTPSGAWTADDYMAQLNASRPIGRAPRATAFEWR